MSPVPAPACRFVLAQRPEKDPQGLTYVWDGKGWRSLL